MLDFYERSYFFKDLLNFNHCLQKASDLSQLWYREYHLELTMGTMIQVRVLVHTNRAAPVDRGSNTRVCVYRSLCICWCTVVVSPL